MTFASPLHRTLLVALACLALSAPAALARPADVRSETPTSWLAGTTDAFSPPFVVDRSFDGYREPTSSQDAALAQERSYSTYGAPARLTKAAATTMPDTGGGIAWMPFVLALLGALMIGLGAGSGLHRVHARRHAARLAI
jgi:hypothetical protein